MKTFNRKWAQLRLLKDSTIYTRTPPSRINKIRGLRILQEYFPSNCVDCLFISRNHLPEQSELKPSSRRIWHVRSGRVIGSELNLPQGVFSSEADVRDFIKTMSDRDTSLDFVVHRVDLNFFSPIFVGTLALFDKPYPFMQFDLQQVLCDKTKLISCSGSPRDLSVSLSYRYDFLSILPRIFLYEGSIDMKILQEPIIKLWSFGRILYDATHEGTTINESVARFNIYDSGKVVFDDFRSVESFYPVT